MIHWLVCPADECPGNDGGASPPDFLSLEERRVYADLAYPKRRRDWLLGRWTAKQLLRRSLAPYRACPLGAISVGNDPDGAPYFSVDGVGRLPVSLSVSHRDDCAFCALSPALSPAIGADIERVEPRALAFVGDFFTPGEAERVRACSPSMRDTLVTVTWSAKEAVLKALRHGLRVDTRRVEILYVAGIETEQTSDPWRAVQVRCTLPGAPELVAWWRPHEAYVLTLASVQSVPPIWAGSAQVSFSSQMQI